MKQSPHSIVATTVPSEAAAARLARLAVDARLAACAQFWPLRSVYRWQGRIESGREYLLHFKTRGALAPSLCEWLRPRHGYELPEILVLPVTTGSRPYLDWIEQSTTPPALILPPGRRTVRRRRRPAGTADRSKAR